MKLKPLAASIGIALSFVCASAQSQQVLRFEDNNIEFLLNANGSAKTSGSFEVGDVLLSIFEIESLSIDGGLNTIPAGQELTGVAIVQLSSGTGSAGDPFLFSAYSAGFNSLSPVNVTNGGAGGGATVAMFLNDTATFDLQLGFGNNPTTNCTSLVQCMSEATAGSLFQVDGFAGDADERWQSVVTVAGGDDPSVVAGLSGALGVAQFNAAQTTFFNSLGPIAFQDILTGGPCPAGSLAADGCVAGPVFTGPATGGAGLNPALYEDGAFARSDFDATKILAVPEPGTVALVGLSLLGLAATRRRNRQ